MARNPAFVYYCYGFISKALKVCDAVEEEDDDSINAVIDNNYGVYVCTLL